MPNAPATAEIRFLAAKNQYFSNGVNRHRPAAEFPQQPNSASVTGSDTHV